jgi:hypothetical protein
LQLDNQVRRKFSKQFGTKTELLENKEEWNLERAMGIEPTSEIWETLVRIIARPRRKDAFLHRRTISTDEPRIFSCLTVFNTAVIKRDKRAAKSITSIEGQSPLNLRLLWV